MKEIKILAALLIALVAMSSCSSEDLPVMVPVDADGEWYAEVAMTGTTYDMRSEGELIEVNYDHIGVKLSLKEGIGEWTHYYIKDGEMVNYEGGYDNLFEYTTAGDGTIQVNSFDELDDLSFVKSLNMRYRDSRILTKVKCHCGKQKALVSTGDSTVALGEFDFNSDNSKWNFRDR